MEENRRARISPVKIAGITYDNLTRTETIEWIGTQVSRPHRARMICTPNADHIVRAQRDPEFRRILDSADLVVADGMAVVYASYLLGTPLKQNVGGRLLVPEVAKGAPNKAYKVFLLGGSNEEIAAAAAARLRMSYPRVQIVGFYAPPLVAEFDGMENDRMVRKVNESGAEVLFVGVGTPKQEKWIARNLWRLDVPVTVGVGIAIDMLGGRVRQPPGWLTRMGLEWLARLWQEPRRLGQRYLVSGPLFLRLVMRQRMGGSVQDDGGGSGLGERHPRCRR